MYEKVSRVDVLQNIQDRLVARLKIIVYSKSLWSNVSQKIVVAVGGGVDIYYAHLE